MKRLLPLIFLFLLGFSKIWIVEEIIDGDTIVLNGKSVRLIGIDCPETSHNPRISAQREFGADTTIIRLGKEAKNFVEKLVPIGTKVKVEFDVQKKDKYNRLLAYVWLPDGRMLNEVLLEEGYATLLTIPPNVKYLDRFSKALQKAKELKKGIWNNIK